MALGCPCQFCAVQPPSQNDRSGHVGSVPLVQWESPDVLGNDVQFFKPSVESWKPPVVAVVVYAEISNRRVRLTREIWAGFFPTVTVLFGGREETFLIGVKLHAIFSHPVVDLLSVGRDVRHKVIKVVVGFLED